MRTPHYEPGGFAVSLEDLQYYLETAEVAREDYPAFVHEWCHYLQDIATISAQNGFYLWLRDVICLTKITCASTGQEIHLPLKPEDYGGYVNKHKRLYGRYCEEIKECSINDPKITAPYNIEVISTKEFTEDERVYARCFCYINGEEYVLSLVALQEINAYYAQKIAEEHLEGVEYRLKADDNVTYPYHLGDILFDEYKVTCDIKMRFCITFMCLDTLQPPVIFLKALEHLEGQNLDYAKSDDILKVVQVIAELTKQYAHSNEEAYREIFKDYNQWLADPSHQCMVTALKWYVEKINRAIETNRQGAQIIPVMVCENKKSLCKIYWDYKIPLFKIDGIVTPDSKTDQQEALATMTFWMLKKVCALLVSQTREHIMQYSQCPFLNHCQYKEDVDKEYDCYSAYWAILENETKTKCPFGIVLHTMGLWQNKLVVDEDRLD